MKYEFPIDTAIKSLKFRRNLYYLPVFSDWLMLALQNTLAEVDGLVPVPLHHWRQAFRGFNQAFEIAEVISRRSGLALVKNVRRVRATKTQSGLNADERKINLHNAFDVVGQLAIRHPLVIDDVMTTGETCSQLAATLLAAGAQRVRVLVIARAQPTGVKPRSES